MAEVHAGIGAAGAEVEGMTSAAAEADGRCAAVVKSWWVASGHLAMGEETTLAGDEIAREVGEELRKL